MKNEKKGGYFSRILVIVLYAFGFFAVLGVAYALFFGGKSYKGLISKTQREIKDGGIFPEHFLPAIQTGFFYGGSRPAVDLLQLFNASLGGDFITYGFAVYLSKIGDEGVLYERIDLANFNNALAKFAICATGGTYFFDVRKVGDDNIYSFAYFPTKEDKIILSPRIKNAEDKGVKLPLVLQSIPVTRL